MNDQDYLRSRIRQILDGKIAMGAGCDCGKRCNCGGEEEDGGYEDGGEIGEGRTRRRAKDKKCQKYDKKGKYWCLGKDKCIMYKTHMQRISKAKKGKKKGGLYPVTEMYPSSSLYGGARKRCSNICTCPPKKTKKRSGSKAQTKRKPAKKSTKKTKNPWMNFLKKYRRDNAAYIRKHNISPSQVMKDAAKEYKKYQR